MEYIRIEEASQFCGVPHEIIITFIEENWISPRDVNNLDEEDLARIRLIWELRHDFGVNDEAMPIILNLIDQLYRMHLELQKTQIH